MWSDAVSREVLFPNGLMWGIGFPLLFGGGLWLLLSGTSISWVGEEGRMPLFLLYLVVMFYFFILFQYGYRQLKRQQAELDLARSRDDFWVSMSHELRTPLTSIIGNSELLGEEVKDPELKALITSIERAGRTQLLLVNDILDMSKIESGKFTIDTMPFDLHRLLSDVELRIGSAAEDD